MDEQMTFPGRKNVKPTDAPASIGFKVAVNFRLNMQHTHMQNR
jgi:hypothetical protein